MRLAVFFLGALGLLAGKKRPEGRGPQEEPARGLLTSLALLKAQGTGNDCPHKKSATLLPSFTVTPTATESTASPGTMSHRTTTAGATSQEPTTTTHKPPTTPSHGNTTVHPTMSNSTTTSPNTSTSSPHPGPPPPPPPPPSPSPGPQEAIGDYTWTNGSQPCVRLQAQIQIGVLYPTQGGGEVTPRDGGGPEGQGREAPGCGAEGDTQGGERAEGKEPWTAHPCSHSTLILTSAGLGHLGPEPQQDQAAGAL